MPPKPTSTTSKDLEDAIHSANQHFEAANTATNNRLTEELQSLHSKIDSQRLHFDQQLQDREEHLNRTMATNQDELRSFIVAALQQREPSTSQILPPPTSHTTGNTTLTFTEPVLEPVLTPISNTTLPLTHTNSSPFTGSATTPFSTSTNFIPFSTLLSLHHTTPLTVPLSQTQTYGYFTQPIVNTSIYPPPPPYPPPPFSLAVSTPPHYNFSYSTPPYPKYQTPPYFWQTHNSHPIANFRNPKVEMASFDGSEALDWLFQADQFFSFYNITPEHRVQMVAFYMKGEALSWYK